MVPRRNGEFVLIQTATFGLVKVQMEHYLQPLQILIACTIII